MSVWALRQAQRVGVCVWGGCGTEVVDKPGVPPRFPAFLPSTSTVAWASESSLWGGCTSHLLLAFDLCFADLGGVPGDWQSPSTQWDRNPREWDYVQLTLGSPHCSQELFSLGVVAGADALRAGGHIPVGRLRMRLRKDDLVLSLHPCAFLGYGAHPSALLVTGIWDALLLIGV